MLILFGRKGNYETVWKLCQETSHIKYTESSRQFLTLGPPCPQPEGLVEQRLYVSLPLWESKGADIKNLAFVMSDKADDSPRYLKRLSVTSGRNEWLKSGS
jgi:hypothetical protein